LQQQFRNRNDKARAAIATREITAQASRPAMRGLLPELVAACRIGPCNMDQQHGFCANLHFAAGHFLILNAPSWRAFDSSARFGSA